VCRVDIQGVSEPIFEARKLLRWSLNSEFTNYTVPLHALG
jgi:hypothetical protein